MEDKFVTRVTTLSLIGLLFVLAFLIIRPIIFAIIFGLIFAYILSPVYRRINKYIKIPSLSTSIILIILVLAIAIPAWLLVPLIVRQTFDSFISFQTIDIATPLQKILPGIMDAETAKSFSIHFNNFVGKVFSTFLNQFTTFLTNIASLLLQFVVFLFVLFFAIKDSDKLKEYICKVSPFSESTEKKFLSEFRVITNAVVYGQILIGVLQGIALGLGLFILGVPNALVLTLLTMLLSIIPLLGPFLVWLPVAIYLLVKGSIFSGIFLLVYGTFFVSIIDNILRPVLLSRDSNLNVVLGVIGTIGGLYYFGIIGLLLGPLILAYILIIFEFYHQGKLDELFKVR